MPLPPRSPDSGSIDVLVRVFRVLNSPVVRRVGGLLGRRPGPPADAIELPAYPERTTV